MERAQAFKTLRLDQSADGQMVETAYWTLVRQAQSRATRDTDATLDIDALEVAPGTLSTDDAAGPCSPLPEFQAAPLLVTPALSADALSQLEFGGTREQVDQLFTACDRSGASARRFRSFGRGTVFQTHWLPRSPKGQIYDAGARNTKKPPRGRLAAFMSGLVEPRGVEPLTS